VNRSGNCNNAAFKFDLASLKARIQTNSVALDMPGLNRVCVQDTVVFQNQSIGGQTFFWDFGDNSKLTKTDRTNIFHKYALPGEYTVKLKAVDLGTCVGRDSTTTKVSAFIPLGFAGPDQVMCFDAGTTLVAGGGVSYKWKSADKLFSSIQPLPKVNPKESSTYYVSITDVNDCSKKDTVNIRVVPSIDLKFNTERFGYDCFNRPSVKVESLTDSAEDIFFDFGDGTTSDLPKDTHTYSYDGLYPIRIVGRKEACVYDKEIKVPIFELKVPNVFTPEHSIGFNDTFVINYGGQPISKSTLNVNLVVYNRWGGTVYENRNYKDEWTANDVSAGIYYYDLQVEGETACKGWVQVIK
jgi:CHU_C Type IX secretion signal domain/PKD domain